MAAEAAGVAAAVEVYQDGKSLISLINRKVDYAKNLENNCKRMINEAEKLYARRDDNKVEAKGKQLKKECEIWINTVGKIEVEVRELERKYTNEMKHRWGWHRIGSVSKLSQKLTEMSVQIQSIREDGKFEKGMVDEKFLEPVKKIHGPNIEVNTSLYRVLTELLDSLRESDVKRIGLWGFPGIGKTTILQNLNDDENIGEMFDIVIWVAVSQNRSIKEVQNSIAERLKLSTKDCSTDETAYKISEELENKKYLLLIDEVWRNLDLHAIGIRGNQKDGKIVFTAREKHICLDMLADRLINVKRLSDADAWKMFSGKVGQTINRPGIKPIAKLVVKECAGLPLLIEKVAEKFRRKEDDIRLWRDGLKKLRIWESDSTKNESTYEQVLEILKFLYEDLDGEDKKKCFLYSALYPEDCEIYIDYLLECWYAEDFIPDVQLLKDARDSGHAILYGLINVSLVEINEKKTHIKMNKVLRNMALRILSRREDFNCVARAREGLEELRNEKEWEQANRISLIDNKLWKLPESPKCTSLLTLLLQRNHCLENIPKQFFQYMENLRVLDLHGTGITSLPATVFHRVKALYLNSCSNLTRFPSIEEEDLHLEVLDIRGTGINNIPLEVGTFSQLRCLRISLSNSAMRHLNQGEVRITTINRGVISRLSLLEELSIEVDPHNPRWDEAVMAIYLEVAMLKYLVSLSFCFPGVDCLHTFITSSSLSKNLAFMFHFSVGYHASSRYQSLEYFDYPIDRCLKLIDSEGVDHAISNKLEETEAFELINHSGILGLSDFGIQSMNDMRGCLIERCNGIETIINVYGHAITEGVLGCLEKMYITNVPNLIRIWEGPVHAGSLAWLETLNLQRCASLKKIFSNGMIQLLSQLQHLRVEECPKIEELIMVSENGGLQSDSLPNLKTLVLRDLPKLTSIWAGDQSLDWSSLERIQIFACSLLKRLPFHNNNASRLISIEGEQAWWSSLEWKHQSVEQRLRSICILN